MRKHYTLGILAHVDAGKTTLCEGLLFNNGIINKFGRVDKQESFLDYIPLERKRGITIFSKEAIISEPESNNTITLLDTPGHVDFVFETLSCMEIMDAALLVIDSGKSLSSHAKRLIFLLQKNNIPIFVFANKTDISGLSKKDTLKNLEDCGLLAVDFGLGPEEIAEGVSLGSEELLNKYLESGEISDTDIKNAINFGIITPVIFGAAIKNEGINELSKVLFKYLEIKTPEKEGFIPYKIRRDDKGTRLIYGRLFGSPIQVKSSLGEEKIEEIRLYNGEKYENIPVCEHGMTVAIRGPKNLQIIPSGHGAYEPLTEYSITGPAIVDPVPAFSKLQILNDEMPYLQIHLDKHRGQILLSPMGDIQMEILKDIIAERFNLDVFFLRAGVIYAETISSASIGFGHFEPLRHYAEAHLMIEPNPGRGIEITSNLSTDSLDIVWQNQVLSALKNTPLRGVAIGARLTDVKITLRSGRAHEKHTESGDFREAALRALRQGLMKATTVILEPLYRFHMSFPQNALGKILAKLETMEAVWSAPEYIKDDITIAGTFPADLLGDLPVFLASVTSGFGDLSLEFGGYIPARHAEDIVASNDYNPERDLEFPADSVFTSHGGSLIIPWFEAENHMHLPLENLPGEEIIEEELSLQGPPAAKEESFIGPDEIDAILGLAGGANKRKGKNDRRSHWNRYNRLSGSQRPRLNSANTETKVSMPQSKPSAPKDDYLLVDGYNIIFAWDFLKDLSKDNIDSARDLLVDILSEYSAYTQTIIILVFDAYKVAGGTGSIYKEKGIDIVFTRESQTADAYIEKTSHEIARKHNVTVATSDRLEQIIVRGEGAIAMSAAGLLEEIKRTRQEIRDLL